MQELEHYVITYYPHLMTEPERMALRDLHLGQKLEHDPKPSQLLLKRLSKDPEVLELLREGTETFYQRVTCRILRERADEVFLNRCPQCGGLARTPQAKQCPHCFFSWRGG